MVIDSSEPAFLTVAMGFANLIKSSQLEGAMTGQFKESIVARIGSLNDLQKSDKSDDSGSHDASRAGEAITL